MVAGADSRDRRLSSARLSFLFVATASTQASHLFSDTAGHTTLEQVVTGPDPDLGYANLTTALVSGSHLVRDGVSESNPAIPNAQAGRDSRRTSLAYFGQLTDFQLADEETPAKVEFLDPGASSAWRPQESLQPFIVDWSIRQMNLFAGASPVTQGDGSRAAMDFCADDRRPGRQRAAQRDDLGARAARGRHAAQLQQRRHRHRGPERLRPGRRTRAARRTRSRRRPAASRTRPPRRLSTPASRTTPTTTRATSCFPQYYDPERRARHLGGERLPDLHGPDGPRADARDHARRAPPSRAT